MLKKLLTCLACIIPFSACSVNFLRGEFSYIDHHIALDDLIRAEWHFHQTGVDPYQYGTKETYVPDYIVGIYSNDKKYDSYKKEYFLFQINDPDLIHNESFLFELLSSPCKANIMNHNNRENSQPKSIAFPFIRMKNIIRCRKGYYKLEKIDENSFVIKY
ncbi:hypothetical protein F542_9320 [Bibersteinia trehalosi USDA-ARS-USMARC-188]|uniref:Lipoprotein n=2 Tax=Bibersteinia trehalosi TaxID=47735 RepID=A0A4V7I9E5_BIBTR|nr:hypothetical protein [Bibersteinia trehalosi]AGH38549.1 hypothetical protein WQG_12720 [Bibersteinia trehalosi USDA-ARS-USMARC-192]AHG81650.1 hypothetical protein F542_9320 [Bibersteinia trehalosi USDA-ARS-USMARC-188]AHG83930.1 hypothetical protein F543_10660 [Bibersteinia trehalosi USDA-ARS-USMARC-189]